ncbi:hypothetical protein GCM10018790_78910 [Kitasatospora xanthocidica]|nr:hypothetical protein GCM10018790_78910 [Kitasatospora xanthocidica]
MREVADGEPETDRTTAMGSPLAGSGAALRSGGRRCGGVTGVGSGTGGATSVDVRTRSVYVWTVSVDVRTGGNLRARVSRDRANRPHRAAGRRAADA